MQRQIQVLLFGLLPALAIFFSVPLQAQLEATSRYDSLSNFPEDPLELVGQSLSLRQRFRPGEGGEFRGFRLEANNPLAFGSRRGGNPNRTVASLIDNYDLIVTDAFQVFDTLARRPINLLELRDTLCDFRVYYEYPKSETEWLFFVDGFVLKLETLLQGAIYISRQDRTYEVYRRSGEVVEVERGDALVFKSLTMHSFAESEQVHLGLILMEERSKKHFILPYDCVDADFGNCPVEAYRQAAIWKQFKDFGTISDRHWKAILNGKVRLGMSFLECQLAWGIPDKKNAADYQAGKLEVWTYRNRRESSLVFLNQILIEIR